MNTIEKSQSARECPFCQGDLETVTEAVSVPVGKRIVDVTHTHPKCPDCGEILLEPADLDFLQREAANRIRENAGLLAPAAIRAIRNDLGLSQDHLEQVLRAAPKSVTRWERGTVCQSGAADSVLRLFGKSPAMVAVLAADRGLDIPLSPKIKFAYSRYLANTSGPTRFDSELAVAPAETEPTVENYAAFDAPLLVASR